MMPAATVKPKVLINIPSLKRMGGVAALYKILKLNEASNVDYFEITASSQSTKASKIVFFIITIFRFIFKVNQYDIVHLNPSFNKSAFLRDAIFLFIAKTRNKQVIVHWHGWRNSFERSVSLNVFFRGIFQKTYAQANQTLVLNKGIKEKLLNDFGLKHPVTVVKNVADDSLINNDKSWALKSKKQPHKLLFLSRVETDKGIHEAIKITQCLSEIRQSNDFELVIAGEGSELDNIKVVVEQLKLKNVFFEGFVSDESKHRVLSEAYLLLHPSHHEGLPLVILEAMIYGLPIVSRPVGGIAEHVIENKNGYLIESLHPEDYVNAINELIDNKTKYNQMSAANRQKAVISYTSKIVRNEFQILYLNCFNDGN